MQLSRSRLQHSCPNNNLSILSHLSKLQRGVAREEIDPKTQGPINVSKILKDLLVWSQKMFVFLVEIMRPTSIPKLRVGKEIKVFDNVK